MKITCSASIILASGLFLIGVSQAPAEEETLDSKAASEIIETLQATVGNLSEFRNLPPSERVTWVKEKAAGYVQDKLVSAAQDGIKQAMNDYAAAAFRAKAFETIALPALKNNLVAGLPLDWSSLEAKMLKEADGKTIAFGVAVKGAAIVWDSVDAFSESGALAGFSKIGSGIGQAMAEAYIPGWGWFQLGVSVVQGLGNYVLGYATDTAVDGMLCDMFGMKSNPEAFSRMLQTTTPAQLTAKIDDGWELVSAGRAWQGQGTDVGDQAMQQRLKDRLMEVKAQVAHQAELKRKQDAELRTRTQPYLDAASRAEANLKAVAGQTTAKVRPLLTNIKTLQRKVSAQEEVRAAADAAVYASLAQPTPGDILPYTPLPSAEVLAAYRLAFDLCQASVGGSFSYADYSAKLNAADILKYQTLNSQPTPGWGGWGAPAWYAHQAADIAALTNEILVLQSEAYQRISQQYEAIQVRFAELTAGLRAASTDLQDGLQALRNEAGANLQLPEIFDVNAWLPYTAYLTNYTEFWLANRPLATGYGQVEEFERIQDTLDKLEYDRSVFESLDTRRKKLVADYYAVLAQVDAALRLVIPMGCQNFGTTTNYQFVTYHWSMTDYMFAGVGTNVLTIGPEWYNPFDVDAACARMRARLNELQPAHDIAVLKIQLQRVNAAALLVLNRFPPPGDGYTYAVSLKGKVNDVVNYRLPLASTDLSRLSALLQTAWGQTQSRLALLQRNAPFLAAGVIENLYGYGANLTNYQSVLAIDQTDRNNAPATAATLMTSYQNILSQWPATPPTSWGVYEYDNALSSMSGILANAQRDLTRAKKNGSPIYTLMENDLTGYIAQFVARFTTYQAAYASKMASYGMTLPVLNFSGGSVTGRVGQTMTVTVSNSDSGGTFSSPNLPSGLTINSQTGTISGKPTQAGWQGDVVVVYNSAIGVPTRSLLHLQIALPELGSLSLTLASGAATLRFQGQSGSTVQIQKHNLHPDQWWQTVGTASLTGQTQGWTDTVATDGEPQFYRLVSAP